jgi:hypothetical protein
VRRWRVDADRDRNSAHWRAVVPPSITSTVPLQYEASSEAR